MGPYNTKFQTNSQKYMYELRPIKSNYYKISLDIDVGLLKDYILVFTVLEVT